MSNSILRKIQKLLALSKGTSNQNEAAAAAAQAQRLMDKYSISEAMLGHSTGEQFQTSDETLGAYQYWRGYLAQVITQANNCGVYRTKRKLYIYGKPTNIAIAREIFNYCEFEIDFLTIVIAAGRGRVWTNNFRIGCVDSIADAIREEKAAIRREAQAANQGSALIVLDGEYKALRLWATRKLNLRSSGSSHYRSDQSARRAGQSAGRGIYQGRGNPKLKG